MTRINEVLYFVLYDLCKIKKTQNKSASVFSIGTPENYEKKSVIQHSVKD